MLVLGLALALASRPTAQTAIDHNCSVEQPGDVITEAVPTGIADSKSATPSSGKATR